MSEFEERPHFNVESVDIANTRALLKLAKKEIGGYRIRDPVEASFLKVAIPELSSGGRLRPHMNQTFAMRRTTESFFPPGYALRSLEFSVDKQMRQIFPADMYPLFFGGTGYWNYYDVFSRLDMDELFVDMQHNLQSSMADAYGIYHLLSQAFRARLGDSPTVLDVGSSMGFGLKKWLLPREGFKPIKVLRPPRRGEPIVPGEMEPEDDMQPIIDNLTRQTPTIGLAVAFDEHPVNERDPDALARVFSHTFPMSESERRPDEVAEFYRLASQSSPKILASRHFINARDASSSQQLAAYLPDGKADIGILSAVLFEQPPEVIGNIFNNLRPLFNEGALCFVTDFINHVSPNGFSFIRGNWWQRPGSFASYVMDPHKPDVPPVELARFTTRRATEMWLSPEGKELLLGTV